jgi:hypothetical protein
MAAGQAADAEPRDPRWRWVRAAESKRAPGERGFGSSWVPSPWPKPWQGPNWLEIALALVGLVVVVGTVWDAVERAVSGAGFAWWSAAWWAFIGVAYVGGTVGRRREFVRWHAVLDPAMERLRSDPSALGAAWAMRGPARRRWSHACLELSLVDGPVVASVCDTAPVRLALGSGIHRLRFERAKRAWLLDVDIHPDDALLLLVGDGRLSEGDIDVFRITPVVQP